MISAIGTIVGFYIITKMISLNTRKEERKESSAVQVMAIITILVTVLCLAILFFGRTKLPNYNFN